MCLYMYVCWLEVILHSCKLWSNTYEVCCGTFSCMPIETNPRFALSKSNSPCGSNFFVLMYGFPSVPSWMTY